jgi:hypothetical protein
MWRFRQLGGERKTLELAGYNAPFGRPRAKPVVTDGIHVRNTKKYYPGGSKPARHLFGVELKDYVLNGRFMDRENGPGGARRKVEEVKEFVRDQQTVVIEGFSVGVAVTGVILDFDPARESGAEIAWTMTIGIDTDVLALRRRGEVVQAPKSAALILRVLDNVAPIANLRVTVGSFNLSRSFLDAVSPAIDDVQNALGSFARFVGSVDDLENASIGEIRRLRFSVNQLSTAAIRLQTVIDAEDKIGFVNDLERPRSLAGGSAGAVVDWDAWRAQREAQLLAAIAAMAELERQAEILEIGDADTRMTVYPGDTWETLSVRAYGRVDNADLLRRANGAGIGERPKPGSILVPANR